MKLAFILFNLLIISFASFGQESSNPVLKKELLGKYEGSTKKGLAHGQGTALGEDSYTGHFVKGLPDGEGTYTYKNGSFYKGNLSKGLFSGKGTMTYRTVHGDSIVDGYWSDGNYVGKNIILPYEISDKSGSVSPSISRIGDGDKVEITVIDPFSKYIIPQIIAIGEFTLQSYYSRTLYADAKFPLTFEIRYSCPNKYRTGTINNTIRIKFNKPGSWQVTLRN